MSYYYITEAGEFVDSSSRLSDPKYIQINEQEYAITRLIIRGYSRAEIEYAVDRIFRILSPANKVLHTDACPVCDGATVVLSSFGGVEDCVECGGTGKRR